jgi:dGTPase
VTGGAGLYDDHDQERWVDEPPKRPGRSAFERDRARVLHSASFRRLAGKTQVLSATESDFLRTRLTHSLEVAQIGRGLGLQLGADPDLVETACLAHDLGHPPFGHNGEEALDVAAQSCGGFEGNAQTLRILTRLEAKTFAPDDDRGAGRSVGLNLTRAGLDAATKYPWLRGDRPGPKFGAYADDLDVFAWLRDGAPRQRRCIEAQVMDWADDIAYCVHDVEDAVHAGHLRLAQLDDPDGRAEVAKVAVDRYLSADLVDEAGADLDVHPDEVALALAELRTHEWWPQAYDGSRRSLASLKNLTSQLIGRYVGAAQDATREEYGDGPLVRYHAQLLVPRWARVEVAALKAVAAVFVMGRHGAQQAYARQRSIVLELADAMSAGAPRTLGAELAPAYADAPDEAARLRVVVDAVAALTDASAVALHATLVG